MNDPCDPALMASTIRCRGASASSCVTARPTCPARQATKTIAHSGAKRATTTIPIVDPVKTDPAALGLGASLAHPSGNITGIAQFGPEAASKRAEFLKEALPRVTRVAVLVNPADASIAVDLNAMRDTAKALKLELQVIEAQSPTDFRQAFSTMAQRYIEAIVVSAYPISGQRSRDLGPCD